MLQCYDDGPMSGNWFQLNSLEQYPYLQSCELHQVSILSELLIKPPFLPSFEFPGPLRPCQAAAIATTDSATVTASALALSAVLCRFAG